VIFSATTSARFGFEISTRCRTSTQRAVPALEARPELAAEMHSMRVLAADAGVSLDSTEFTIDAFRLTVQPAACAEIRACRRSVRHA
jgi:hypothetical protein